MFIFFVPPRPIFWKTCNSDGTTVFTIGETEISLAVEVFKLIGKYRSYGNGMLSKYGNAKSEKIIRPIIINVLKL